MTQQTTKKFLIPINGAEHVDKSNRDYSLYTATNRGIPSAWDGQKDGGRKALWVLRNKTKEIKTIALVGEMIANSIYLHGDTAAADSISKMAAYYQNTQPLIKGIGNFGARKDPDLYGAARYTGVVAGNVTKHLVYPDLDIVPLKDNYDGSTKEPEHFLPIIPLAILNGIEGIAMGFSTNILPHSLQDVIQATLDVLNNKVPSLTPKYDCIDSDYPVVLGKNKFEFLGSADVLDDQTVVITNLPPGTTVEKMMTNLYEMEDNPDCGIKSVKNDSKDYIKIIVKFNRGFCKGWNEDSVIEFFKLYKRNKQRLVMVDWDNETMKQFKSSEEYVIEFVENRFKYYIKRYENMLLNAENLLKQWSLIKACYDEDLPKNLKTFKSKADLVKSIKLANSKHKCGAEDDHIEKVAALPTYRWVKDHYAEVLKKIKEINSDIAHYKNLLGNHDLIWDIYLSEVENLQKESKKFLTGRESEDA